jgi:hypothetical protein
VTRNLLFLCELRDATTMLEAALIYATNGWAVFPLIGKLPPKDFEGGFHNATTDEATIRMWWSRWPDANIGWPLPLAWFAVDEDPRHAGDFARTMLELAHGRLPLTLRQITGGGGFHWIYRHPDGVSIHQRSGWFDGIDTRASGRGYIILEPSVHPDTGNSYRWHTIVEPVMAPDWLVDIVRMREAAQPKPYVPPVVVTTHHLHKRERYGRAVLAGLARKVAGATEGSRNDLLNWAWWKVLGYRDVVPESDARAELTRAALSTGLDEREIAKVLR